MMKKIRKAIHFGVSYGVSNLTSFDGEKDAEYFHLLLKQKGYHSTLVQGSETKICSDYIKQAIKQLKLTQEETGTYFISISAFSYIQKNSIWWFKAKKRMKSIILSDNDFLTRNDLIEILSYFNSDDRVFFLVSDCESKKLKNTPNILTDTIQEGDISVKAAVLSLGLNPRVMKQLNISSGAVDFEQALKSSKSVSDVVSKLNELNESNLNYVNTNLLCFNTHQNSEMAL